MGIEAISGIGTSSMLGAFGVGAAQGAGATSAATAAAGADGLGASFGATLTSSVDQLQAVQSNAKTLAVQAVTGDLDDIHDYTIAAAEASTTLELTAALRNKAVDAFTEIMRMQA